MPLAAIDMGSNSFRLEIGQLEHGLYRRIDYVKETVRLGGALDADGRLTDAGSRPALACLGRFADRLRGFSAWQVRAVATQTLREARNRDQFLDQARAVLGHDIEVISGREEARLIYAGVSHLQPTRHTRLVIDIGGRSTELILGRGTVPEAAESFPVGSVGLSMRYFADGVLSAASFRAAQVAAGAEFEEALSIFDRSRWEEALGSSGTAAAVSQVLLAEGVTDGRITPQALSWCIERCIAAGHVDRVAFAGMREDRRPVLPGGLAILYTLCALLGIETLQPAKGALRQGVIIDLDARLRAAHGEALDMRDSSVAALQQRFAADLAQAARVQRTALALFGQIDDGSDAEAPRELGWAAALHEIGMAVSHHDHHRHSAYLVANVDAAGFSQSQQRYLAGLVLGQRGGLRKVEPMLEAPTFAAQLLCLRLAVVLHHGRRELDSAPWRLRLDGGQARIAHAATASIDPRTLHLLREEAGCWQRSPAMTLQVPG